MQIAELIVSDNVREVDDMKRDPFEEYLKESEPDKANKGYAWSTAIGLQAVDGLKTSEYLIDTAIQNIEGKITMREAQELINSYYEERPAHFSDEERTEIRYLRGSQDCFLRQHFHFHLMNIFQSTESFLWGFTVMQGRSEIIILRKRNGCWMVQRLCMAVLQN